MRYAAHTRILITHPPQPQRAGDRVRDCERMGCQLSLPYPLSQLWGSWGLPSIEAGGGQQGTEVNQQYRYSDN